MDNDKAQTIHLLFLETWPKIGSVGRIFFTPTMVLNYANYLVYSHILRLIVAFYFHFTLTCFVTLVER